MRDELHGVLIARLFTLRPDQFAADEEMPPGRGGGGRRNQTAAVPGIQGQTMEWANAMAGTSCDSNENRERSTTFEIQPEVKA